jgi:hypothetical protein
MWRNPKYYPAAPATAEPAPPEPAGETLIEFERNRGAERLRVSLEEYQGHEYVRLQVWARGPSGDWWPVKGKCVTVKLREVDGLVAALRQVEGRADHQASGLQQGRARAVSGLGVGGTVPNTFRVPRRGRWGPSAAHPAPRQRRRLR